MILLGGGMISKSEGKQEGTQWFEKSVKNPSD